jgi:hypothetical protein
VAARRLDVCSIGGSAGIVNRLIDFDDQTLGHAHGLERLLPLQLPHRRRIPWSGRQVKGREAVACGAVGALDLAAATGTLRAEEDAHLLRSVRVSIGRSDRGRSPVVRAAAPGRPPQGPQPGASVAGRSGDVLIQYGSIRQRVSSP